MGCATSKEMVCPNCKVSYSPARRSYSWKGGGRKKWDHAVELNSSTLGSLTLHSESSSIEDGVSEEGFEIGGVIEDKSWSEMIEEKIPKFFPRTPAAAPAKEAPEVINSWELMEGLEDVSPAKKEESFVETDSNPAKIEFISEEILPENHFPLAGKPPGKLRAVMYFTSLRGVRKTYEDCCEVAGILKGLKVRIDERDVSMHSRFKSELAKLGQGSGGALPRVFVGKECIGGADEIRRLNDEGKLQKMIETQRWEVVDDEKWECDTCGNMRFIPCRKCSGSCKILYEAAAAADDGRRQQQEIGFHRCPDCNENGLTRCPICCGSPSPIDDGDGDLSEPH